MVKRQTRSRCPVSSTKCRVRGVLGACLALQEGRGKQRLGGQWGAGARLLVHRGAVP